MESHIMVAGQNVDPALFTRREQGVKSKQSIKPASSVFLAPLDIVVELCWGAPKALVEEIAKKEYVLWTKISLGRLKSSKTARVKIQVFFDSFTCAFATLYVVCQTSGRSLSRASECLPRPSPSWRWSRRWGRSTATAPGSRQRTRSRRGCRGGKGRPGQPASSCADPSLMLPRSQCQEIAQKNFLKEQQITAISPLPSETSWLVQNNLENMPIAEPGHKNSTW